MKKFIAIAMVVAILLGMCAGCGKKKLDDKYGTDGRVKIQVGMASNIMVTDLGDGNALTKWLEEQTGYDIEVVEYAGGSDVATQISTTIAAGQALPDILFSVSVNTTTANMYGRDGYFLDLKPYYDDKEKSKNFCHRLSLLSEDDQEYVVQMITDKDSGGMYAVPSVETSLVDGVQGMAWINEKWLAEVGMDMPTNSEELYQVLKAFKQRDKNCIPLYGSEKASMSGGHVLSWLINQFMYYNTAHMWQDYNGDGKIENAATQDSYREALKYIRKLYAEGLLYPDIYVPANADMKKVITPSDGNAKVGVFCGHLSSHTVANNELLYDYTTLPRWGCATENDIYCSPQTFITDTAEAREVVDECFNLLMTLWTAEGSMRVRYGEKGVNWDDADAGAKSDYGLDATYKLISDPLGQQNSCMWANAGGTMTLWAEGESAQSSDKTSKWFLEKSKMHAENRKDFDKVAAEINPTMLANPFLKRFDLTDVEKDQISMEQTNVNSVISEYLKNFIMKTDGKDINNDAHWQEYLDQINANGYEKVRTMYQKCYESQK